MKTLMLLLWTLPAAANPPLPILLTNEPPSAPITLWLTWDLGSTNEPVQGFNVYCGPSNQFYTNVVFTTKFSQVFSNVNPDGEYHYAIKAVGINGLLSPYSAEVIFPPPPLTNWSMSVQSTISLTNDPRPHIYFALCESTDLSHWRPAGGASNTFTQTRW